MKISFTTPAIYLAVCLSMWPATRAAGQEQPPPDRLTLEPGQVITRFPDGTATIRATRVGSLKIDGRLDEPVYREVPFLTDFVQTIPDNGKPATQRTEAWVFFDDATFYVSARCYDNRPESEWMANEMRRDNLGPAQDDFGFGIDTFFDRRNGYQFYTNPLGRRTDQELINEGVTGANWDWNPVWEVRTGRFEGGWTVEMAVPFKSLRYRPGKSQIWGMQLRRTIRSRNEWAWLTPLPISIGPMGIYRISTFPTLVGLEVPSGSKNLDIKPYLTTSIATDHLARHPYSNDPSGKVGFDLKYGVTQNLTVDMTVNTDLAQVEVDDQQVNLTRFNISFPEKRDFFLEGQKLFEFGATMPDAPNLFYSRQIGIQGGRPIKILGGGRMTGKVGRTSIGALSMQTDDEPTVGALKTNFTALRVRQDVLRRSSVGAMFTNRSSSLVRPGAASPAYGIDGNFAFFQNVEIGTQYARSEAPGVSGPNDTYGARFSYGHDRYGLTLDHLYVADGFRPEVGFVSRDDLRRTSAQARFSPRPASGRVEQYSLVGHFGYTANTKGVLETRDVSGAFTTTFENTQAFRVTLERSHDVLDSPFAIVRAVTIPAGAYSFNTLRTSYTLNTTARVSGSVALDHGGFYGGDDTGASFNGRVVVTPQLSLDPFLSIRRTNLPGGSFTTRQYRARIIYAFSPLMFFSGLIQHNTNSHILSMNLRLRWEYSPGSELFLVYTEEDDAEPLSRRFASLRNRSIAFKMNRLFRF